jgi:TonB-linked SusC/RagA family outer membrane protein
MKKINDLLRTDPGSCPEKLIRIIKFCAFLTLFAMFGFFQNVASAQDTNIAYSGNIAIVSDADGQNDAGANLEQRRITGTVKGDNNEPLVGATIQVQGTTLGTLTDADGRFSIDVPDESAVLVISYIGYITQVIPVSGRTTIDVVLAFAEELLEEIVVIGYGTQKKGTMTGSVSVVKGEEVAKVPTSNITGAMGGKLAGVLTRQQGGQPGSDNTEIHIRGVATTGDNAPMIVIDGVIRDKLNQVDPSIIESVVILKDAAAVAPYGLNGANGVILITTKKGQVGLPTMTFNTYYGVQTPTYYPDLLNAVDYMKLRNEAVLNENPTAEVLAFDPEVIENYASYHADDPDRYPDSNTDDLVDFTIPIQKHDLQISGGTDKLKYFAALGYFGQAGLFERVGYHRFNYNLNLTANVTNTTLLTFGFIGSQERVNDLDVASSANQLFRSGYKFIPTESIYYSNGLWGQFAGNSPVAVLEGDGYEHVDRSTLLTSITVEQQLPFIKGLSVKGAFSYDANMQYQKGWHTPFYYYTIDMTKTPYTWSRSISTQEGNVPAYTYLTQRDERGVGITFQGYINYARAFGRHDITGLLVAEFYSGDRTWLSARRNNYNVPIDEMNLGSSNKSDFENGGMSYEATGIGYVYRIGWRWNNRYMIESAGRYDGHYYFAPNKKWGFFPSVSIGWRISEEDFMKNLGFIDNLKLRGSWGETGNLAGSAYQYLAGYTLAGNAISFGTGTIVQQAYVNTENNPNITWEVSKKSNIGFEAELWHNLLNIEFDFFYERRSGMLLSPAITVPFEYGLNLAQENAGKMNNYGFELQLGTRRQFQNGLNINVAGNISLARNKMIETFETAATYNNPNRRRTGRALNTQFGYKALGLFQTSDDTNGDGIISTEEYPVTQWGTLRPGDIKYEDQNGDNKINSDDEVVIGYPNNYPLMTFGLNPNATWKGFDLSLFFQGSAMMSYRIYNFMTLPFLNNNSNADYEYYNNRWTKETPNAKYPLAHPNPVANNEQQSTFWTKSAAYLRLKNAQFGYTLPRFLLNAIKIQSIRVYVASQNMFTISGLKFMDPESANAQWDGTFYPTMKSYTIGANVTF